jgi:hypothetical protein
MLLQRQILSSATHALATTGSDMRVFIQTKLKLQADGRLAQVQTHGGARDIAFARHRDKRAQGL